MPLYEFECKACGKRTESVRTLEKRWLRAKCRWCGEVAHRVISAPSVHTETSNPLRKYAPMRPVEGSLKDTERAWERDGVVMASGRDFDIAQRRKAEAEHAERKELAQLEAEYRALPAESKTFVSQSEFNMLEPAEKKFVPKEKILPDVSS